MQEVSRFLRVRHDVVAIGREPRHAIDRERNDRAARAHEQPADRAVAERDPEAFERGMRGGLAERGAHALHRDAEPRGAEGLEDVVERAELEGLDRMLDVRGREHDVGLMRDSCEHVGAEHSRHLHVEEHELGLQPIDAPRRRPRHPPPRR